MGHLLKQSYKDKRNHHYSSRKYASELQKKREEAIFVFKGLYHIKQKRLKIIYYCHYGKI
jgi:hypothetical protein